MRISGPSSSVTASIIIPYYNMGKYLQDALDSVFKQSFTDYEVIIVNDGSDDPYSLKILEGLDKDKIIVINQKNKGLPAARNRGVQAASGKYVSCLDADDKLHRDFLRHTIEALEQDVKEELGFVGVQARLFGLRKALWKPLPYEPLQLLKLNLFQSANLFRLKAWQSTGGYNERMTGGYEDWDFWIGIVEKGYKWAIIPQELIYYRIRKKSMVVASNRRHPQLYRQIVQNHPKIFQEHALDLVVSHMEDMYGKEQLINHLNSVIKAEQKKSADLRQAMRKLKMNLQEQTDLKAANNKLRLKLVELEEELGRIRSTKVYGLYAKVSRTKQRLKKPTRSKE